MNCSARDGRPSLSILPGEHPAHALLFLHEGAAAIVGGIDRKGFIRRRGFWLLALLWPLAIAVYAAVISLPVWIA